MALAAAIEATGFRAQYQRNNKRDGLKNLRCFPCCSSEHNSAGFCGRSVVLAISGTVPEGLECWGEFATTDPASERLAVGQTIARSALEAEQRGRGDERSRPLLLGSLGEQGRASFNAEMSGWHYGYRSVLSHS